MTAKEMGQLTERISGALSDRYRIERRLGEGGMATVYLAEDLKHDRRVAVKVLRPELAAVLGADRFVQEISDIYSLGCVLYEMLTGEAPHMGTSAQQIIMKIVTEEAQAVTKLRKSVPPNVAAAVAKSLAKLPADRFERAAKFAEALTTATFALPDVHAGARGAAPRNRWQWVAIASSVVAVVAIVVAALGWLQQEPTLPVVHNRIKLWATGYPMTNRVLLAYLAAVAPDGSSIVYVDTLPDGRRQLFRKPRDQSVGNPIVGTAGAVGPFFSPDGEWVGYFEGGRLRKMPSHGGGSITRHLTHPRNGRWVRGPMMILSCMSTRSSIYVGLLPPEERAKYWST